MYKVPSAHAALIQALTAAEADVAGFFESLPEDEFVDRQGDADPVNAAFATICRRRAFTGDAISQRTL